MSEITPKKEAQQASPKKVVINSIVYASSGILLKCFSFFLLPLYTAYLSTEDYGITSIATSFINTMGFVVAFSLFSAVMRFYVELKETPDRLKRFYGTISIFVFISSLAFGALLTIGRTALSKYVFSGIDYYPVILICLVTLVFYCQQYIFDNILRSQQKAMMSSILSIASFFVTVAFNVLFVVVFKMGAVGSLLATMITYMCFTLYFVIYMTASKQIHYCLDFVMLKDALKYSLPIMPHNLSTQIALLVSKVLIGDVISLGSLGVYTVATQFGNIADTVQGYVDQAYGPWLYEKLHLKEVNYKNSISGIVKLLIAVIGFFFVGISLFAQDYILLFINKEYNLAWVYVPCIVLVFAIKTIYYFYVEILFYYKKASKYLFTATLSSSIFNIILSFFMIKNWGVWGSILADAIAMMLRVSIVVYISTKFDDIGLRIRDFVTNFIIILMFICVGLGRSFIMHYSRFSLLYFCFKVLVICMYVAFIIMCNKEYVGLLRTIIKKRKL